MVPKMTNTAKRNPISEGKTLVVHEARVDDVGKGLARIRTEDMAELGLAIGDVVEVIGSNRTVAKVMPIVESNPDWKIIQIDGVTRENAGVGLDDFVEIRKSDHHPAETLLISPIDVTRPLPQEDESQQLATVLAGLPVVLGDKLEVSIFGFGRQYFVIEGTVPHGAVVINPNTLVKVKQPDVSGERASRISYEDIGGLDAELQKVREVIEFPMKYPELFKKLGIEAPKGLLLVGPSGTGKTLIARAIASEVKVHFIHVNGPEIMHKFYGESEARLRQVFEEANANAPSIIFIDEIDAIVPKRTEAIGNVEKRVVAQLLVLLDGLVTRGKVVVIGATNAPNLLDPALRRPGRFDREIMINPPNRLARLEILRIHTRPMSLHPDVDLEKLAELTHGFVGADLEALVKEAGMAALRRILSQMRSRGEDLSRTNQVELRVRNQDFLTAYRETEPSALREFLPERPGVTLADVGDLGEIKKNLTAFVDLCLKPSANGEDTGGSLPRGFFFVGSPGTGKTLLARAIAGELELPLISIYSSALFSRWVGESEKELEQIFRKAKQVAPCILLLDEVDSIAPIRRAAEDSGVSQRIVNQLLREIDNTRNFKELIIIATTNRMDLVDPALVRPGRFDYVVRFDAPDEEGRLEIFKIHTKEMQIPPSILKELARMSQSLVGSDIESLCRRARLKAIQRHLNSHGKTASAGLRPRVSMRDFQAPLEEIKRRIDDEQGVG
jgi:transitional endoplasmic reticulum ATPase